MTGWHRARSEQYAQRINDAVELLSTGNDVRQAMQQLAKVHGLSERQAYRYITQARKSGKMEVPSPKVVFTVNLPTTLVNAVRRQAKKNGETVSGLVARGLQEFLNRIQSGSRNGR